MSKIRRIDRKFNHFVLLSQRNNCPKGFQIKFSSSANMKKFFRHTRRGENLDEHQENYFCWCWSIASLLFELRTDNQPDLAEIPPPRPIWLLPLTFTARLRNNETSFRFLRAAPGTDPNNLAPAAPATGEDGEVVGGPRWVIHERMTNDRTEITNYFPISLRFSLLAWQSTHV